MQYVFVGGKKRYLIHVNGLESFSSCKNECMILVFGLSFSYFGLTRQFYSIYFLWNGTVTKFKIRGFSNRTQFLIFSYSVKISYSKNYLIKIINSLDKHRVEHFLHFSSFSFLNLINICYTESGVAAALDMKNEPQQGTNQSREEEFQFSRIYSPVRMKKGLT